MEKDTNARTITLPPQNLIQKDMCCECVFCESAGEFVLPDYLPQIRKIIRVTSRLMPRGKFIGGERAEFAGEVVYSLIYLGDDGMPASTNLQTEYEFSFPISGAPDTASIFATAKIDQTSYRISGPRKISFRTRVCALPHIYYDAPAANDSAAVDVMRLSTRTQSAKFYFGESGEIRLSDMMKTDAGADVKPLWCRADAGVGNTSAMDGGVMCRGDVYAMCMITKGGDTYTLTKKIPFEEFVPIEGVRRECMSRAVVKNASLDCTMSDDGTLSLDCTLELCAHAAAEMPLKLTADAYSLDCECSCDYSEIETTRLLACKSGSYTVSGVSRLSEITDLPGELAGMCGEAIIDEIIPSGGRFAVCGKCKINAVFSGSEAGDMLSSGDFEIPFKIIIDAENAGKNPIFEHCASLVSCRGRTDGENLFTDAEVFISLLAVEKEKVRAVNSLELDKAQPIPQKHSLCVIYPDGESLWQIAKRYHTSAENIAALNLLPDTVLADLTAPAAVGRKSLLVEE